MKNIINKIKNISLEQINKNLIFVAIASLLFRSGYFSTSFIPKPFELIVLFIILLAIIDAIKNNKIKEFFFSIPRNIRIALLILVISILFGWCMSLIKGIPTTFDTILEFGSFLFSLSIFLLILFYTRNDKTYIKWYLYALFIPIVYNICIIFPNITNYFNLTNGVSFIGFTTNENIISKMLLIPTVFFISITLFESKNIWIKTLYIFISSGLVALLFWVSSRAALLSLVLGCIFVWLIYSLKNFNWGKLIKSGIIIFTIILMGFVFTPYSVKQVVLDRILNSDGTRANYFDINFYSKSIIKIVKDSSVFNKIHSDLYKDNTISETRFQFWPVYLKYVLINPLGIGPNTHVKLDHDYKGGKLSLGPHNTYLEIWLWGGIFGLGSFIYFLFFIFKNIKNQLKLNFNIIDFSLVGILFTMLIVIIANDSLPLHSFWVILALSLKRGGLGFKY